MVEPTGAQRLRFPALPGMLSGTVAAVLMILAAWSATSPVWACYAVIVGRKASADGSVLVGHNEQNGGRRVLYFSAIPQRTFDSPGVVRLLRGGSLPQVHQTWAFLWSENPGLEFSDAYLNQWGVAVVSDGCPTREDDYQTLVARGQIRHGGIGYMLRRLVAQRARSAREGVELAGRWIERFGYVASGRTYVIADPREAWLLAVVRGRRWVARRVPDDRVVLLPNVHIIEQVDLEDRENFMASGDLISYAVARGWFDPAAGRPFNFRRVYGRPEHARPDPRRLRGRQLVTGKFEPAADSFGVKPARKMTVEAVAAVLRDRAGPVPISNPVTQEGAVFQLRSGMPPEIGCVYWRCTAEPATSVFTPWYAGITTTPPGYDRPVNLETRMALEHHFAPPPGTFDPNPQLVWWTFRRLQDLVHRAGQQQMERIGHIWKAEEAALFAQQAEFERKLLETWKGDPQQARRQLTEYCTAVANRMRARAEQLVAELEEPGRQQRTSAPAGSDPEESSAATVLLVAQPPPGPRRPRFRPPLRQPPRRPPQRPGGRRSASGATGPMSGYGTGTVRLAVDAGTTAGTIRNLLGTNRGPVSWEPRSDRVLADHTAQLKQFGFHYIRTHDYYGPTDWYVIFPNWDADPDDPASYDFRSSDLRVRAICENGFQCVYRLGTSWRGRPWLAPPINDPPGTRRDEDGRVIHVADRDDFRKFARICVGIVRHYTEGWANGYRFPIRYWEIWNEPDLREQFWSGTVEQFYDLYEETARAIKQHNPKLRVGGPACTGALRESYVEEFLRMCRQRNVPLDFFSWHSYGGRGELNPCTYRSAGLRVRKALDRYGFKQAENFCTEWNAGIRDQQIGHTPAGAAFCASAMVLMLDGTVDKAFQYCGDMHPGLGLFERPSGRPKISAYAFAAWKQMLETPQRLAATGTDDRGLAVLAGRDTDGHRVQVLISDFQSGYDGFELRVNNLPWDEQTEFQVTCRLLDAKHRLQVVLQSSGRGRTLNLTRPLKAPAVYLVEIERADGSPPAVRH